MKDGHWDPGLKGLAVSFRLLLFLIATLRCCNCGDHTEGGHQSVYHATILSEIPKQGVITVLQT
jgi:hypothetical protein